MFTFSRRRLSQLLATLLILAAAAPIVWYWAMLGVEAVADPSRAFWRRPFIVALVVGQGAGLAAAGIALALVWRAWGSRAARTLAVFLGAFCLYNGGLGLLRALQAMSPARGELAYDVVFAGAVAIGLGALVRFSALFPGPPHASAAAEAPEAADGGEGRLHRVLRKLRGRSGEAGPVMIVAGAAWLLMAAGGIFDWDALIGAGLALELVLPLGFAVASLNLWTAYREAGPADRAKIFWVAEGVVLLFLGLFLPVSLDATLEVLGGNLPQWVHWYGVDVSLWGFVGCLAIAVFGRGAVHSDLVFRSTTMAGALTVLALFAFAGFENLVTDLVFARIGLPAAVGTWVAGGLVAVLLNPVYRWMERRLR